VTRNGIVLRLPPAFTVTFSYFLDDSVCSRWGGCQLSVYLSQPSARYKNLLCFRIRGKGQFELVSDGGNPALGPNKADEHYFPSGMGLGKSLGRNTAFHREQLGEIPGYDAGSWHRVSLSFHEQRLSAWLDGQYLGTVETGILPVLLRLEGVMRYGISDMTVTMLESDEAALCSFADSGKLVTQAIHFNADRFEVKAESLPFLRQLADWMKGQGRQRFEIGGHTDASGDAAANLQLSQQRAEAIRGLLIRYGVAADRLVAKGYGASRPVAGNAADRAANRRVEFRKLDR
jgi:outer membrane protein OmpA-like peptidoglycan-associated protein